MPTGYTAYIEDGDITTGKEFLLLCSRAFGVAIDIRDKPLSVPTPTHFEPNEYYKKRYDDAVKRLEEGRCLSFENARNRMRSEHIKRVEDAKRYVKKMTEINKRYADVRSQVEAWTPPSAEHNGIKTFALEQIDMCVNTDDMFASCNKIINEQLDDSDAAVHKYLNEHTKYLEDEVARAKKNYDEEIECAKRKTQFMKVFYESLENM